LRWTASWQEVDYVSDAPMTNFCTIACQLISGTAAVRRQLVDASELDRRVCADRIVSCREFSSKDLRTVGNYSLGRLIGKGSFGKVYLATHRLTNGSKVCFVTVLELE